MDFDALYVVSLIHERAEFLALGISNMLTIQPVENIVLGGKITSLGDGFLHIVRESVERVGYPKLWTMYTCTIPKFQRTSAPLVRYCTILKSVQTLVLLLPAELSLSVDHSCYLISLY